MRERGASLVDSSSYLTSLVAKMLLKLQLDDLQAILGLYNAEQK